MYKIEDYDSEDVKDAKDFTNKTWGIDSLAYDYLEAVLDDRSNWVSALFTLQQCALELRDAVEREDGDIDGYIKQFDIANETAEQLIGLRETPDVIK